MLSYEIGPFSVFFRLRGLLGFDQFDNGEEIAPDTFFGNLFACVWCLSFWIAIGVWIAYRLWTPTLIIAVPFALSAVAIMVERINHE
ncbi:hypothetical protein LCGC14_1236310 [marine sediment metagenome]|uniref:DUF1360 domain-containing protein n=1 Tax=marine sediment metagenome TaxID=412755 RepID=A0A0F9PBC2_9ZZZZ